LYRSSTWGRRISIQQQDFLRDKCGWTRDKELDAGEFKEDTAQCQHKGNDDYLEAYRNQFETTVDVVAHVAMFAVAMVLQMP
jgi:hypothetical protein